MYYRTKPYLLMTSANEIARNCNLLDAVESIIGSDILLWDSAYVIKEPKTKKFEPMLKRLFMRPRKIHN